MVRTLASVDAASAWLAERVPPGGAAALRTDSRQVQPGDAFIAWPGYGTDGRRFVAAALAAGAAACLVEAEGAEAFGLDPADARIAALQGLKAATGPIAAAWFGAPARALQVIAATGTNGKSSTAWWTAQALSALGRRCGVVGTLGIGEPPRADSPGSLLHTGLTTPDPVTLQAGLRRMADAGFAACAIEASSIGLVEHRLAGTPIALAQFTNFTRDHLDFHGDMAAYWAAKRALFAWPGLRAAVVNVDDAQGAVLAGELASDLAGTALDLWTTARAAPARLRAEDLHYVDGGLAFTLVEGDDRVPVHSRLIGDYNADNLLAALGALRALGLSLAQAASVVPQLSPVPGRMDRVPAAADQPEVVVDYAHTPDALDKALSALRPLAAARGGALWCVFGCGGNRDASKRPLMGAIAHQGADRVVLTSDNPRLEDPTAILQQIRAGLPADADVTVIEDRRAAIAHAVRHAAAHDVVLIAGKGHEDYQDMVGQKRPFSDAAAAAEALAVRTSDRAQAGPHAFGGSAGVPVGRGADTLPLMTLAQAHALLPGSTLVGDGATPILRVHTDTRSLARGDLFVALRGERFDAHAFLPQAVTAGAAAALAEHGLVETGLPGLLVPDALAALQQLATAWRARLPLPLIAVTGSNGKTTVTQMVAAILRAWQGDAALATAGNYNNHIGVPLTVLRLRQDAVVHHRVAVLELGMNHPGEIAQLAAIARPTVAVVNNAQREHQEFMASVQAVAEENGAVIAALPADGVAVFPADDAHAAVWQALAAGRPTLTFALGAGDDQPLHRRADVHDEARWLAATGPGGDAGHWALRLHTPAGAIDVQLHMAGLHNVHNAMAAATAALAAGAPLSAIVAGLEAFRPVGGRSKLGGFHLGGRWVTLVDDSYNANPDSVRAAISMLATLPGPHWLVLGDMGEVGDQGPTFHAEVGAFAYASGIAHCWTAGAMCSDAAAAYGPGARHFDTTDQLIAALGTAPACASVLVKGSRFMRMETVVAALQQRSDSPSTKDTPCC